MSRRSTTPVTPLMRKRTQSGSTLIEALVAVVILAITVTGIGMATSTSTRASGSAQQTARRNALLTAFAEAVKSLPYQTCATPQEYQDLFDSAEAQLTPSGEDLRDIDNAQITVVWVTDAIGGAICPGGSDPGTQRIGLNVTLNGKLIEGSVAKRDPANLTVPIEVDFTPVLVVGPPDPSSSYDFTLTINVPNPPVGRVEFWCDANAWADPNTPEGLPDFDRAPYDGSIPSCVYTTPSPDPTSQFAAVRVTDRNGATKTVRKSFTLAPNGAPINPPLAQITLGSTPDCSVGTPCSTNTPISFQSDLSFSPYGLERWEWNFGDGTPTYSCTSAEQIAALCSQNQTHEYEGGGAFTVVLTVTDSFGLSDSDSRVINVNAPPLVKPTAVITATPTCCVAPTRVRFDGTQSHADGVAPGAGSPPGGITNYSWNFGDGSPPESGSALTQPEHTYVGVGRFTARLTVTATNGTTNYATIPIDMSSQLNPGSPPAAMSYPSGFWNSGARKGDLPLIRDAYFDLQWVTVARNPAPYDTIQYQIVVGATFGFCGTLGVDTNGRIFTTPPDPGSGGVVMNYRADFGPHPWWQRGFNGVCATDDVNIRIRTMRTNELGTFYSPWSPPITVDPQFF
ncbi:MAG: PKD domain-containing protein [Microthrixaceae bacterium]|nr:PKD domain-containing protein [Microthrixaceae bacterium]